MAAASAAVSASGASRPVTPSSSQSGMPPTAKPTTGRPRAMASIPTMPKGSGQRDGTTLTAARA